MGSEDTKRALMLGFVAGALMVLCIQNAFQSSSRPGSNEAWGLFVGLTFKDDVAKAEFKTLFAPFAEYVEQSEPHTLSYMYMDSDKDPQRGLIVERYLEKDKAFLVDHKNSQSFLKFREKLKVMQNDGKVKLDGESYQEGIGYMS